MQRQAGSRLCRAIIASLVLIILCVDRGAEAARLLSALPYPSTPAAGQCLAAAEPCTCSGDCCGDLVCGFATKPSDGAPATGKRREMATCLDRRAADARAGVVDYGCATAAGADAALARHTAAAVQRPLSHSPPGPGAPHPQTDPAPLMGGDDYEDGGQQQQQQSGARSVADQLIGLTSSSGSGSRARDVYDLAV